MNIQGDFYIYAYMHERFNEYKNKNLKKINYLWYSTDSYELALSDNKHAPGIVRLYTSPHITDTYKVEDTNTYRASEDMRETQSDRYGWYNLR
jgi:hypothetical protein